MSYRYMVVLYYKQPDGMYDESTTFHNRLKTSQLQTATVILDLKEEKVIRHRLNPEITFNDALDYYKNALGDKLTPYLD